MKKKLKEAISYKVMFPEAYWFLSGVNVWDFFVIRYV